MSEESVPLAVEDSINSDSDSSDEVNGRDCHERLVSSIPLSLPLELSE